MTRQQKIAWLSTEAKHDGRKLTPMQQDIYEQGILAGIRLRDEELLAVEFNDAEAKLVATTTAKYIQNKPTFDDWFSRGAEWQHEQILLKIKGTE